MQDIKRIDKVFKQKKGSPQRAPQHENKDTKKIRDQYYKTSKAFGKVPKTMLQVSIETGILRANICRYVATMRKRDAISIIYTGICPISKHRAGFYLSDNGREVTNER